ncbi:hypothetical protein MNBD_NITROSPINAE04-109 [hydrothermal vent metagenome]|uniref:Uncharacterized protein n=1 Tax=hydrothermal vent metagenome TaxID=652676 RepID=A0A3B1CJL2_9ZZZZ
MTIDNGNGVDQDQAWVDGLSGALVWGLAMLVEYYPLLIIADDRVRISSSLYSVNAFFIAISIAAFSGFAMRLTSARMKEAAQRRGNVKGSGVSSKVVAVIDAVHTGFKWNLCGAAVWVGGIATIFVSISAGWGRLGLLAATAYLGALGLVLLFMVGFVFSLVKKRA